MSQKIRRIHAISEEEILPDLERYREMALSSGAADAKIITTDQIIIDNRVRMKCLFPICEKYGTNAHCPPYIGDLDQTRELVKRYKYALFIMLRVPSSELTGLNAIEKKTSRISALKLNEMVSKIESAAFYDGYHLAIGFSTGCKGIFCQDENCSALILGRSCHHPLKARAGMDAVGMDAYTMAANMGWDIYPCGKDVNPNDVPHGTRLGLVLIH